MLIIKKKLNHHHDTHNAELKLTYEERSKSRLHCFTANQLEVGIFLPHGQPPLQDGDFLQADDGMILKVIAEPEELLHVTCDNAFELTRTAYHLGNRHVALEVGDGWLRLLNDYVIKDMLEHLQAKVTIVRAPFNPEQGAYHNKHAHEHTHTHHTHGKDKEFSYTPKLHEF